MEYFTISADPVLAHLGPLAIRWYSLAILLAIGAAAILRAIAAAAAPAFRAPGGPHERH